MRGCAVALLAAGCAAAAARPPDPQPSPDPALAKASVEKILHDSLAALERSVIDASAVAPDAFSWGIAPRDVFTSRKALAGSAPPGKFTAQDLERRVFVAPDGRSAWFWEFYTRGGRPVRHTGLAGELDGRWLILAQHTSFAHGQDVDKRDEEGTLPDLAPVGDGIAPGAEDVGALFRKVVFLDRMLAAATPPDFVIIGTDPGYLTGSLVRPVPAANDDGPRPRDGLRAGLGPGGLTAWAAANVVWIKNGKRTMGPLRFMFVFAKEGARWREVQNHHSYALE